MSLSDLQPLGIPGLFARAYRHHCDLMTSMRNSRRLHDHIRRLTKQRHECTRLIHALQVEMRAQEESREAHDRDGDAILSESCVKEIRRVRRSALRLMNMRSLIDHFARVLSEETVGVDLLLTLDSIAHTPFVRMNRERLDQLVRNVQHRTELTREQSAIFDSLMKDLDDVESDAEMDAEPAVAMSPTSREDLERLAEISAPQTL